MDGSRLRREQPSSRQIQVRLESVQLQFDEMVARVERAMQRGVRDEGVLAWCRARVEIPDEMPFPTSPTSYARLNRYYDNQYARHSR